MWISWLPSSSATPEVSSPCSPDGAVPAGGSDPALGGAWSETWGVAAGCGTCAGADSGGDSDAGGTGSVPVFEMVEPAGFGAADSVAGRSAGARSPLPFPFRPADAGSTNSQPG